MAEQIAAEGLTLEDLQHWTWIIGRAQQMLMSHAADVLTSEEGRAQTEKWLKQMTSPPIPPAPPATSSASLPFDTDPARWMKLQADFVAQGTEMWRNLLSGGLGALTGSAATDAGKDRRFAHQHWEQHPLFSLIRQTYLYVADQLLGWADRVDGIDPAEKARLRFQTQSLIDALAPTNFALTNPAVIERTMASRGENLLKGLEHMLADLKRGQLKQTDTDAFVLGENIAATPGKVVARTDLYELIHYAPTTPKQLALPLVIFPAWINRFYILDLGPKKSFVQWALDQGISVFMVSWKSADASMKDYTWDNYIRAQIEAVDTVRDLLDVPAAHCIGYCVAGTTLAATLAVLGAKGEADRIASATFFTAQVDFEDAGDLKHFLGKEGQQLLDPMQGEDVIDGRYLAATFNLLRGRDLIWNYVVNNYLLGEDYTPFDLLYWNGDSTNLPARWHREYLRDLYEQNLLSVPGRLSALGTPIDLGKVVTPTFIQAGREDHIAPPNSVWKLMTLMGGPKRFVLAGSGHVAGVVNPPASGKYQYWTNDDPAVTTLDGFIAGATEHPGSWWPSWAEWLRTIDAREVDAKGARIPGKGKLKALEDAPGSYVKAR